MALNFNLLAQAPNLGAQFAAGQDAALQAQQARQQMAAQQQQMTVSGMQMQKMQREEAALAEMQKAIVASGGPSDMNVAADAMIKSGVAHYMDAGLKIKQTLAQNLADREAMGLGAPGASAVGAAPAGPAPAGPAPAGPAPTNALAPGAPPAAAPTNAMIPGAAPAAGADKEALIRQAKMMLLSQNPGVRTAGEQQLKRLSTPDVLHTVGPGGSLIGPSGNLLFAAPFAPTKPTLKTPEEEAQAIRIGQATRSQVNVKLPEQEKEEKGARGKLLVKQYEGVSDAAKLAGRTLPALETQERVLDSGFKTGFGTDAQKAGASVLAALGVPEAGKFATDAQTFLAATQQAVLQRQLEQKGPQTESDAQRITQTGAQLGNTPDANKFLVAVAKTQLKRDIEQRNFYDKWWKQNNTYDGAEDAWSTGPGGKSLFDAPELKKYAAPAKPASAPTAPGAAQPIYARNPTTGQRIMSIDGGNNWTPAR